ncbi:hypothetical protein LguiB_026893 [Lonicera macranthoides]
MDPALGDQPGRLEGDQDEITFTNAHGVLHCSPNHDDWADLDWYEDDKLDRGHAVVYRDVTRAIPAETNSSIIFKAIIKDGSVEPPPPPPPPELSCLGEQISLNLSRNNLSGPAIQKISQMKKLEILDSYRNQLSGAIRTGLESLDFLSVLDLLSNNFSGKIP